MPPAASGVRARRALPAAVLAVAVAAACSDSSPRSEPTPTATATATPTATAVPSATSASPSATSPALRSAWPTYHGSTSRAGDAGAGVPALGGQLRAAWRADLDGAVYASPVLVGSTAVVATEGNTVYALRVSDGHQVWRRHLGTPVRRKDLPCGNIDPLGITGTPAYDVATGSVFVVTETTGAHHTLWALEGASGAVRWKRDLDVVPGRDRHAEQQRAALLVTAGRVLVGFGGLAGDCGDYVGYLASVPTTGRGSTAVFAVPTEREGGIWSAAGPVVGPGGRVYVATGNGAASGGRWDGSDSVHALDPLTMRSVASFAPRTWPEDNAADLDLGSVSPAVVGDKLVIGGKRGVVFLLSSRLGGIGGELAALDGCAPFGGAAVRGAVVLLPCTSGIRALHVSGTSLSWGWKAAGVPGSPVLAGDAVYAVSPAEGTFHVLSLASGEERGRLSLGSPTSRFATPAVAAGGRLVLVPTMQGVVAVG